MIKASYLFRIAFFVCMVFILPFPGPPSAAQDRQAALVLTVHDGDSVTIQMDGKKYRTRLIGIDAPELEQEPWGRKAKNYLRELMKESGGKVFVETDIAKYDKYDRFLVYLWLDDKRMINELMMQEGLAVLLTIQPNSKYAGRFTKAQRIAREGKKNIWGPDGLTVPPMEYKKTHPRQ